MLPLTKPETENATNDWGERSHVQTLLLMAVTALGIYLCGLLAAPFLPALAWALALAVLFAPFQQWLESKLAHSALAAMIAVTMIALIVVVPAVFVAQKLVVQAINGAQLIETKVSSGEWRRAIEAQPRLAPIADKIEQDLDLQDSVKTLTAWLSTTAGSIVTGSVFQAVNFCIIFYLLFFFLRDRRAALHSLRYLSPLSKAERHHQRHCLWNAGGFSHSGAFGRFDVLVAGVARTAVVGLRDGPAGCHSGARRLCRLGSCRVISRT
jgi:predicted PurR-regulated permease PerM